MTSEKSTTEPRGASRFWLIPALTFLVGLVLGGAVIAAVGSGGDGAVTGSGGTSSSTTSAPSTLTTSTSPDATVTVPSACLQVADDSQALLGLVSNAVGAVRDLDAARLSDIVRQLRDAQNALSETATRCQEAAGTSTSPLGSPTSGASSTPAPSSPSS